MAVSVDWSSYPYDIEIPQSDLTLVSGTKYEITVDHLWDLLRNFSDGPEGSARPSLYRRVAATASTPAITEINDPVYLAHFEDGLYSVDIVGGNTNFRDVEVKNQVSVGTNNTTGFINPTFLELGLFSGAVCVDTISGFSGTGRTPNGGIIGTRTTPSNNMADALTIAQTRGLNQFNFLKDTTITSGDFSSGYTFTSDSLSTELTILAAANVTRCSVDKITISGEMDGLNRILDCEVEAVTNVSGEITRCGLESTVGVSGSTHIVFSYSEVAGAGYPKITDIGSHEIIVRDFRGSLGFSGMTGGTHSIGVYGGRVIIEADCTGGQIHVRGSPFEIADNSNGAVTVIDQTDSAKTTDIWSVVGKPKKRPGFALE